MNSKRRDALARAVNLLLSAEEIVRPKEDEEALTALKTIDKIEEAKDNIETATA